MATDKFSSPRKAIVVGAGPVGCLAAISLAKMGWAVEIYEGRPGMPVASSFDRISAYCAVFYKL